jgi:exodeoxyribonuclease-5
MEKPQLRLETVLRQALESPIIALATKARKTGWLEEKEYSEHVVVCRKQTAPLRVKQLFLAPSPDTLRIVATNKARIENNIFLVKEHRRLLSLPTEDTRTPFPNAQIICLQNSRRSALFNGMTGTISGPPIDCLNHWEAPAAFDDQSYTILADKGYFNNPTPERTSRNPAVLPFDFSYTLTCHKAQGSEAPRVFVLGSGFGTAEERRRWLYTAITRARDELYVIR